MVKRSVTGARYGLTHWLAQRLTALLLAAWGLIAAGYFMLHHDVTYADWAGTMHGRWIRIFTAAVLAALCLHAWIGMRNIVMDYIKPFGLRLMLHSLTLVLLLTWFVWGIQVIWFA